MWEVVSNLGWMAVKCRDSVSLKKDVADILDNFGTKYNFAF